MVKVLHLKDTEFSHKQKWCGKKWELHSLKILFSQIFVTNKKTSQQLECH